MNICSVEWEYDDSLPEMSDLEYDLIYPKSEIINGVRMFPFITVYDNDGVSERLWIGV